jgi:hypothetical protein
VLADSQIRECIRIIDFEFFVFIIGIRTLDIKADARVHWLMTFQYFVGDCNLNSGDVV